MSETAPTLPGLDAMAAPTSAMEVAARQQIAGLRDAGLIKPEHGLTVQLILELAAAIGKASAKGQAAALSMASRELREAMELLPKPAASDAFAEFMAQLTGDAPAEAAA